MGRWRQRKNKSAAKNPQPHSGSNETRAKPVSRKRLWLYRISSSLGVPALVLIGLEGIMRLGGIGYPVSFLLPTHHDGRKEFIQNDRFGWRFFGPVMSREPWPLSFPAEKPPGTIRVFVFGESAAYGDPQPEFGLPRMLQVLLEEHYPGTRFEVINCGMTAINSHAILPIARDCASREGDIWVLYMGNNEVVGPFGAGTVFGRRGAGIPFVRASLAVRATRLGQGLEDIASHFARRQPGQQEWGGMEMFLKQQVRQDDPLMPVVYSNFERNLADILVAGRRGGAKIVVSTVASNLKDCAPFASSHRTDLSASDLARWETVFRSGVSFQEAGDPAGAATRFRQAEEIDGAYAELRFRRGQCCLALGRAEEAAREFAFARDEDTLRFRCDSQLNDILKHTVLKLHDDQIILADSEKGLAETSPHGVCGQEYFYEHVHLTFEGNYLLALTIARQVAALLPDLLAHSANASGPAEWPSQDLCARRLGWSDWYRFQGIQAILGRLNDPPFTAQYNHGEQLKQLQTTLETLLPAMRPDGLRAAASICLEALSKSTSDWILLNNLAQLRVNLRDFAGAASCLRQVTQLMPHYPAAFEDLGSALADMGLNSEAESAYRSALKLMPDSPAIYTSLGQLLARQGKNDRALGYYDSALRIKSYYGPAHLGAAKALDALHRPEEARVHYRQAFQDRMLTPASLETLAQVAFEHGWMDAAATNFIDALRLDPANAVIHVNLGVTLASLGRHAEAKEHYQEAVRLDPDLAEAHARLGLELGRVSDDSGASRQFAEAVRLKPDLLEARLDLGIALTKQGLKAQAIEQFQEVLRRSPANPVALQYMEALRSGK